MFGRDTTNHRKPLETNSEGDVMLCKHILAAIRRLIAGNFYKKGFPSQAKENKSFMEDLFK